MFVTVYLILIFEIDLIMFFFRKGMIDDFKLMAEFISKYNQLPTEHCLHCSQNSNEILEELKDHETRGEQHFLLAFKGDKLVGLLGGDSDNNPLTEIWLWGPFIDKTAPKSLNQQLYNELLATFPTIKKMTAFYHVENKNAKSFYATLGFKEQKEATHEYHCPLNNCPPEILNIPPNKEQIIPFEERFLSAFEALHTTAFPKSYYSIQEMMELKNLQNGNFQLWIQRTLTTNELLGYVFANITPNQEGFIHFLAVDPQQRKKGIGSQLLQRALYFFFVEHQLPSVSLTVSDTNNARQLYEKHGFKLRYSGKGAFWNIA